VLIGVSLVWWRLCGPHARSATCESNEHERLTAELFVLALASAVWPLLVAVVIIALKTTRPPVVLAAFLLGAVIAAVGVGLVVVYSLRGTDVVSDHRSTADPSVYLVGALLAFALALFMGRRARDRKKASSTKPTTGPSRTERALQRGAPLAFLAGIVLNLIPGIFPLVALKDVSELNTDVASTVLILLGFYFVMFMLLEVPLAGYLFAPEATSAAATRFNNWLSENSGRVVIYALYALAAYLLVRGLFAL
jgi:hypothetical protein